ncbi:MAG: hypothetical protein ACRBBP_11475 [Bdellovibrionales bacterium]
MKQFISITIAVALWATLASASERSAESSTEYINSILAHTDQSKDLKKQVNDLEKEISTASKASKTAASKVTETSKSISTKEARLESLPGKIERYQKLIETKTNESNDIFEQYFPEADSIDAAISKVSRSRQALVNEKERLTASLNSKNESFNAEIIRIETRITNNRSNKETAEDKIVSNRQDRVTLNDEIQAARQEVRKLENIKNSDDFAQRLQRTRKRFKEIDELRQSEGRNCLRRKFFGGYRDKSPTCITYRDVKPKVDRLNGINDGSLVRNIHQDQIRPKTNRLSAIEREQLQLRDRVQDLATSIRADERAVERLEDDKLIATRPIRLKLAEVDFDLESIEGKWLKAQRLKTLHDEMASHRRNIARYQGEQETLPPEIATLKVTLGELEESAQAAVDTLAALNLEKENLVLSAQNAVSAIEENRLSMNSALAEENPLLAPVSAETPEELPTVIMESRDWNVLTTDNDSNWMRPSCKAETSLVTTIEELEVSADLSVVNLKNESGLYNEPLVTMTVSTTADLDLNLYKNVNLSTSKSRPGLELDFVYSMSDEGKLVFISKLSDRAELINLIAAKNTMYANLSGDNDVLQRVSFSLRGSHNSLKSSSSKDQSLQRACGGIDTFNF